VPLCFPLPARGGAKKADILTGQVLEHVAGQKKGKKMPGHVLGH
jgi:hypothetical protein